MKPYVQTYLNHFNYTTADTIPCEVSDHVARQIHHIRLKGMGGRKTYTENDKTYDIDGIENLIALCVDCHKKAHTGEHDKTFLILAHKYKLDGIEFQHRNRDKRRTGRTGLT